jgi:hypothetical protein
MNPWIYSALVIAVAASAIGIIVSGLIVRRVFAGNATRPVISFLLISMFGIAISQLFDQTYDLGYRAAYDGLVDPKTHQVFYNEPLAAVSMKVLFAMSFTTAVAVKLGLYCDREDREIARWAVLTSAATILAWVGLALLIANLV